MTDELLTMKEAASRAKVAYSTARFYRKRHGVFFPTVGEGRQVRYRPETVRILGAIASAYGAGRSATEVQDMLRLDFAVSVESSDEDRTQRNGAVQRKRNVPDDPASLLVSALAVQAQQSNALQEAVQALHTFLEGETTRAREVETLRAELDALRRDQEAGRAALLQQIDARVKGAVPAASPRGGRIMRALRVLMGKE